MNYEDLLKSKTGDKWKKLGIKKRAGAAVPLFSLYSRNSIGIGEIPDLAHLTNWCVKTGLSIIQLLPLNDTGFDFAPYNSVSTFALDPVYIAVRKIPVKNKSKYRDELRELKEKYSNTGKVDYGIKNAKLKLLWKIYSENDYSISRKLSRFIAENRYWLEDYAFYKIIKESVDERSCADWKEKYKYPDERVKKELLRKYGKCVSFHYWVQWQLFEQLSKVKKYAAARGVLIMGDLPFLVSRDSADVWAKPRYFKTELSAGAPPDMYFADGQRWGMPPYNWDNIAKDDFEYIRNRIKYAANFYDMFRIDHFVGLFRLWTLPAESGAEGGQGGSFDPGPEFLWEEHGRIILNAMNESSAMLPVAEDLGTVPDCSYRVLEEFGVPGMEVQRWKRYYYDHFGFVEPENYRVNSSAVVSTHDSSSLAGWWEYEAGTVDEVSFERACAGMGIKGSKYEDIKEILFDLSKQRYGRLLWKNDISNAGKLMGILGVDYEKAGGIISMYVSSFGEREKFAGYIGLDNFNDEAGRELIEKSLEKICSASSIFSIQLLQEWLSLDEEILNKSDKYNYRINFPGTMSDKNWRIKTPYNIEKINLLKINEKIRDIVKDAERLNN